jgi:hypothetical protein
MGINDKSAGSGRKLKENDQVVNIADLIESLEVKMAALHQALVVNKNAGFQLTGSKVGTIYGAFAVGTTAVPKAINGKLCTVNVLSGTVWINPNAVAVADATAIKLTGAIDLVVDGNLSLISDATGASIQIIVWE